MDCYGPVCFSMISNHYGNSMPMQFLRDRSFINLGRCFTFLLLQWFGLIHWISWIWNKGHFSHLWSSENESTSTVRVIINVKIIYLSNILFWIQKLRCSNILSLEGFIKASMVASMWTLVSLKFLDGFQL